MARKRWLNENRFTKYLVYGFGEIVLVVIGILIALTINNWNEERKLEVVEQMTLLNLRKEVEYSRANLAELRDVKYEIRSTIECLLTKTAPDAVYDGEYNIDSLLGIIYRVGNYNPLLGF